jgi:hypothetical protein
MIRAKLTIAAVCLLVSSCGEATAPEATAPRTGGFESSDLERATVSVRGDRPVDFIIEPAFKESLGDEWPLTVPNAVLAVRKTGLCAAYMFADGKVWGLNGIALGSKEVTTVKVGENLLPVLDPVDGTAIWAFMPEPADWPDDLGPWNSQAPRISIGPLIRQALELRPECR